MGSFPVSVYLLAVLCCFMLRDYVCSADTDSPLMNCSASDLEALRDFKHALNDPESRLSSWQGTRCCLGRGIGCSNSTGAVTVIDLHNPYPSTLENASRYGFWNLSGEISPSLIKLKSLQYLDLSQNTFNGISIPEFLGSLKNLKYLNLSGAGFSSVIPQSLGNLSSLEVLDMYSRSLDIYSGSLSANSLEWMFGLASLKHLDMDGLDLTLVPSGWLNILNKLPRLREVHLSYCGLSGSISSLSPVNFSSLSVIDLSGNSFESVFPEWLASINSLTYIDLSFSSLYGRIPLGLGDIPNLKYLSLAGNSNLSADCSHLFSGNWSSIEVLYLATNKLHGKLPSSIGNMTSLRKLDLFSNSVEGSIPSSIGRLCSLEYFDMSGNNMNGSLPEFLEGADRCASKSPFPHLVHLRLSNNQLSGKLPGWLVQLQNLEELSLSYNNIEGPIPSSIGKLQNLVKLSLEGNELNGTLPESVGQLSRLSILDVSFNRMTGTISEAHFQKLSKLMTLFLSANSFLLDVSSSWIPPFQVMALDMGSCYLGPSFPVWLKSQKDVGYLSFSNASISGPIPDWFWGTSGNLTMLNVSYNQLQGQLPNPLNVAPFADVDFSSNLLEGPFPIPAGEFQLLDLSRNQFSGPIPQTLGASMPNLIFLSLSDNRFSGEIPNSIGEMSGLQVLDLSSNRLTGTIPSSTGNCSHLKVLDLRHNSLSGEIPESLGDLLKLQSLHLNENNLTGNIPTSFRNLSSLETLDLGNNRLSGIIPPWIGEGFIYPSLRIIRLRSNQFSGEIATSSWNLSSLQILDLADNKLSGSIPKGLGDLQAMSKEQNSIQYLLYGKFRGLFYEENLIVNLKGQAQKFTKILSLVTSIDLSSNNFTGVFPMEITKLQGLVVLNLSRNQLYGQIPQNISSLHQLSSLDLSRNKLSGAIPSTMSSLSFLGYLNLSDNNFSGMIPYSGHMTTFDANAFSGNVGLCGAPLSVNCTRTNEGGTAEGDGGGSGVIIIDRWFYMSVGLGFAAGLLVPLVMVAMKKTWSNSYFGLVDKIVEKTGIGN